MSIGAALAWWKEALGLVTVTSGLVVGVPPSYYPVLQHSMEEFVEASSVDIRRGLGDLKLQGMLKRRDGLRKEDFELGEKQRKDPSPERHQEHLRVKDDLENLDREIIKTREGIPK